MSGTTATRASFQPALWEGVELLTLAFEPLPGGVEVPSHAILGHFREPGARPGWRSFSTNPAFVEFFRRFMRGELSTRPRLLEEAKVAAGEYVYVLDRRTPTPAGDVPFHDIIGWYTSDVRGRPLPESFEYNRDYLIVLENGRVSSICGDAEVQAAAMAGR